MKKENQNLEKKVKLFNWRDWPLLYGIYNISRYSLPKLAGIIQDNNTNKSLKRKAELYAITTYCWNAFAPAIALSYGIAQLCN